MLRTDLAAEHLRVAATILCLRIEVMSFEGNGLETISVRKAGLIGRTFGDARRSV